MAGAICSSDDCDVSCVPMVYFDEAELIRAWKELHAISGVRMNADHEEWLDERLYRDEDSDSNDALVDGLPDWIKNWMLVAYRSSHVHVAHDLHHLCQIAGRLVDGRPKCMTSAVEHKRIGQATLLAGFPKLLGTTVVLSPWQQGNSQPSDRPAHRSSNMPHIRSLIGT